MSSTAPRNANEFIENQLDERARSLESLTGGDVLGFSSDIIFGIDDVIRATIEDRKKQGGSKNKLIVVLTTSGGYIEVTQRIVDTLRHHYDKIEFIVTNYAFSAGTVLALSGDAIHMDYYSRLGPIDPQLQTANGPNVPALGYLIQYERLMKRAKAGKITAPELRLMIDGFDQAELYKYEQARELSITLLKRWLVAYKFKNWKKTETRNKNVTQKMKLDRAKTIAKQLNDTTKWHSHGYGISIGELTKDLKLRIDDYSKSNALHESIKNYDDLLRDYQLRRGNPGVIHVVDKFIPLL